MADTTDIPTAVSQSVDKTESSTPTTAPETTNNSTENTDGDKNDSHGKRKRFDDQSGRKSGRGGKRRDMGRKEWQ